MRKADKKLMLTKLNVIRGGMISIATEIEFALGSKIADYFFPKSNKKSPDFFNYIINTNHFTFERKISVYEQIPYFTKLKQYDKVLRHLRYVKRIRNALAHWLLDGTRSTIQEIIIYNPTNPDKSLKLNDQLMKQFREHAEFLLKTFGWIR